jgi:hypothetical protein
MAFNRDPSWDSATRITAKSLVGQSMGGGSFAATCSHSYSATAPILAVGAEERSHPTGDYLA